MSSGGDRVRQAFVIQSKKHPFVFTVTGDCNDLYCKQVMIAHGWDNLHSDLVTQAVPQTGLTVRDTLRLQSWERGFLLTTGRILHPFILDICFSFAHGTCSVPSSK